ncbi:uncharacterized protein LOC136083491 [Hydra vulgaris]|uniref:Uncharacterized protein LOC136083491 n=1 Tax=Hydra vulgaris TaxID=6087 RepID=A0ABM4CBF9_HYDVU
MIIFQHDKCVGGKSAEELKSNLSKILSKLKESRMSINKRKSVNKERSYIQMEERTSTCTRVAKKESLRRTCDKSLLHQIIKTTNASEKSISGILSQNVHPVLKFKLKSDYRPLEFIFDCNKEQPKVTSARILRWTLQMMAFDYKINYKKGENIPHADALSR